MLRKNDITWMLLETLLKKNSQPVDAAPETDAPAEQPDYDAQAGKYSPIGKGGCGSAAHFDWRDEEKVGYEPGEYGFAGGGYRKEQKPQYCWRPEERYESYPRGKHSYCEEPKEKGCCCHEPWVEEQWICTKEARICCERIPCEKKKKDHGCGGTYGY